MENNKFTNFNYMFIDSSLKGHKEVFITYKYNGLPHRKIIFIKEKEGYTEQEYLSIAKAKVENYIKSGKLGEFSRKRPHYGFGVLGTTLIATLGAGAIALATLFTIRMVQPIFTVIWKNYDGTILEIDNVRKGDMPIFNGKNPTKESTPYGKYTFSGWDKKITPVNVTNQVYTAKYNVEYNCDAYFRISTPDDGIIRLETDGTISEVDWGDGRLPDKKNEHEYYTAGFYDIKISFEGTASGISIVQSNCVEKIFINSAVTGIPHAAYKNSEKLHSVEFAEDTQCESIGIAAFSGCYCLSSINLPDSLTSIEREAFEDCTALESITIPRNVNSIGTNAFSGCINLKTVTISNDSTINSFEGSVFSKCENLTSINIPKTVKTIESYAFFYCKNLETINIADDSELTLIDKNAFCSTKIKSFNLPKGVTEIREGAFGACHELSSFTIPSDSLLTNIGKEAFDNCHKLTSISFPRGKDISIGEGAFTFSGLTSIDLSNSVTSIDPSAFNECKSIASISVDDDNPSYDDRVKNAIFTKKDVGGLLANTLLLGCTSMDIPEGTVAIAANAFLKRENCKNITIPSTVTTIGDSAFKFTGVTSVVIPNSVTSIGSRAFEKNGADSITADLTAFIDPTSIPTLGDTGFAYWNNPVLQVANVEMLNAFKEAPNWSACAEHFVVKQ